MATLRAALPVLSRFQARARLRATSDEQADTYGIDFIMIITMITTLLPLIQSLCKKPAPPVPPVPPEVKLMGVSDTAWKQANDSKWAAIEAYDSDSDSYSRAAIRSMSRKIAKAEGIRPKAARPAAIAALDTARQESINDLAATVQSAS